jgi:hypothetical protein
VAQWFGLDEAAAGVAELGERAPSSQPFEAGQLGGACLDTFGNPAPCPELGPTVIDIPSAATTAPHTPGPASPTGPTTTTAPANGEPPGYINGYDTPAPGVAQGASSRPGIGGELVWLAVAVVGGFALARWLR